MKEIEEGVVMREVRVPKFGPPDVLEVQYMLLNQKKLPQNQSQNMESAI